MVARLGLPAAMLPRAFQQPQQVIQSVLRLHLAGANPHPQVVGLDRLPGVSNYFIGHDPRRWRTNVPGYARVAYRNIYPGVDLVYYGNQGHLEYDFVVAPGASPRAIRLAFVGARQIRLDQQGDVLLHLPHGDLRQATPLVYQEQGGIRRSVSGRYLPGDGGTIEFQVGAYNQHRPLIIDPVLTYSTYLGGNAYAFGSGIAVDGAGNAYVTGFTGSSNFPTTTGAFSTTLGGSFAAFVSKLNAAGSGLLYSTFLGGSNEDRGNSIAVDGAGNAYVMGSARSSNFPTTTRAFSTTFGGSDGSFEAFVSKLNATGNGLLYSTYLGGNTSSLDGIAVDGTGNAYVTGSTDSRDFPTTPGAFSTTYHGGNEAFVSKLNAVGSRLLYSTYLGGHFDDNGYGIAVDGAGNAYVTGATASRDSPDDFPTTPGAFSTTYHGSTYGSEAFVSKLNAAGSGLLYSTYLGGSNAPNVGRGIAVDGTGNAYVTGSTDSRDFPTTPGAFSTTYHGGDSGHSGDVFVSKLNAAGSGLLYSTYLGGSDSDGGSGIAVDGAGNAYVIGNTYARDFPTTPGAFSTTYHGSTILGGEAFVSKLNAVGSRLLYSTFLGGRGTDTANPGTDTANAGTGIVVDEAGNAYVTGYTRSFDFPTTPGAFSTTRNSTSVSDVFVAKIPTPTDKPTPGGPIPPPPPVPVGHCPRKETIDGWSFAWASCPHDGRVINVVVMPPHNMASSFQLDRSHLIVHSLAVTARYQLVRPVLLPDVSAMIARFALTARVLAVDTTDVTIRTGTLFLPAALRGLACYPVPIEDIRIEPDTGSSLGAIRLAQPLQFTYAGARFDVDGLALTRDGLASSSARMALPGTFGGRGGFAVEHLLIGSDGSVGGTVRLDTDVTISDFSLHVGAIQIDGDGLTFTNASGTISLPTASGSLFAFHIDDFTFDGTTITKGHLNAQVSLPTLQFGPGGSWTLSPNANNSGLQLTVSVVAGVFVYTLTGDASLDLPFIHPPTAQGGEQADHYASIDAHLEIGSITWDRPLNLYTFGIKISLPSPVAIGGGHSRPKGELPLGDTDLALTSLGGQVEITGEHNNIIYTVGVNAGIQDLATGGLMLDSRLNGTVSNDGNFGVSGNATLFLVAHLTGGICVQVTLSNDRVCRDNLGPDASRATSYGTYASLGGAIDVPSTQGGTEHLKLTGNVFGHLWTGLQSSTVQPTPTSIATPLTGGNGQPRPVPHPTPTPSPSPGHLDYHFYGDANFKARIDAGYFASVHQIDFLGVRTPELPLYPPCRIDAAATGALGTFHYQQNPEPVSGIRAKVTGQMICPHNVNIKFAAHIFYEPPTQVAIGDHVDGDYQPEQGQTSVGVRTLGGHTPDHGPSRSAAGTTSTGVTGLRGHGTSGALPSLVRSVTIAPGETSTFFTMGWAAGSPTLRVIAPNRTVYRTPRNRRAFLTPMGPGAYWFQSSDPHLLTSSSRAAQALYLVHPQPGIWRVVASGLQARARVHLVVIGNHAASVVRVTVPAAGQRVSVRPSAPRVPLAGTVQGGSPTDTVGLYYTTNPTVMLHGQTVANLAGTLIADNVPVRHGRWHYSWDTRRDVLRRSRYYIYAQLNNGIGPIAVGYGRGVIQVVQQNRPGAPRRVQATVARTGRNVVLHWLPPANDGTVFGYVVRWRRNGVRAPRWSTLHVSRVLTFHFPSLVSRAHYVAEVASYDLSGVESQEATTRFVAPAPQVRRGTRHARSRPRPHVMLERAFLDSPRTVVLSLARRHAHHLTLRVVGPACSTNELAGTPYANALWREPGPGGGGPEILVGRLDAVLARSADVRVNQVLYGNLYYAFAGDPIDVMLTARRLPTGKITGGIRGYNKYYNPIIERVGRATGVIAILTGPQNVKPIGTRRNNIRFDPPGWEPQDSHSTDPRNKGQDFDRGHLLGDVLFGSNLDGRNVVAQYANPNEGAQSNLESTVAKDLRDGKWSRVYYRVEPHYNSDPATPIQYVIPTWIEIEVIEVKLRPGSTAVEQSDCIHVDIPNRGDTTIRDVRKLASPIPGQSGQVCQGWPK